MARKSKDSGGDALGLLLAIPVAIVSFFMEHIWLAILLGCIAIAAVVGIVIAKQRRRAAYLRWYYDRDRRIAELNINDKFDVPVTNAILKAKADGTTVNIGEENSNFTPVKEAYTSVSLSNEILHGNDVLSFSDSGRALNSSFGIKPTYKPIVLRYTGENNGGYVFYVFPETILAFVEGPEQVVFLAAYKPEALKITCSSLSVPKSKVVYEKTQYDIRYYDKFCPVSDAEIVSSRWEVVNKDGSRSFKGGLLPEHNPLHFTLRYGKITFSMGRYVMTTSFSRYNSSVQLATLYENFKKGVSGISSQKELNSQLIGTINKVLEKKVAEEIKVNTSESSSIKVASDTPQPKEIYEEKVPQVIIQETPSVIKTPITVDDARYRNRMVANNIVKELNHMYHGQHEFKVYQVRKDRDDWKMQDAGVYTYISDAGTQYAIEFNIRTKTTDGTTELEFFIWCDNLSKTQKKYGNIITKNSMTPKATGYSIILPNDYQGDEKTMTTKLIAVIDTLFTDIADDKENL